MAVLANEFSKGALETKWKATDTNGDSHTVWIYPSPFCAMGFVNDGRYTTGEVAPPVTGTASAPNALRRNNIYFRDIDRQPTRTGFGVVNLVSCVTTQNIAANAELFVSYGEHYNSFNK